MNYDLPGLIPYFNDLTTKFSYILATSNESSYNDITQYNNWANNYTDTVQKLGLENSKYLPHKITTVKKNMELAKIHLANLQAHNFTNQEPFKTGKLGDSFMGASLGGMYSGLNSLANYNKRQQAKYDYWVATVGNTPKGKAMLGAKAAIESSQLIGSDNSSLGSGGGFNQSSKNPNSLAGTKKDSSTKSITKKLDGRDDGGSYYTNSGRPAAYSTHDNSITDQKEIDTILSEAKSNMYDAQEGDSLWIIVTKAYVRSAYPHLLNYKPSLEVKEENSSTTQLIDDEKVFAPEKSKKRKIKENAKMN
jgi:hypothetical protein